MMRIVTWVLGAALATVSLPGQATVDRRYDVRFLLPGLVDANSAAVDSATATIAEAVAKTLVFRGPDRAITVVPEHGWIRVEADETAQSEVPSILFEIAPVAWRLADDLALPDVRLAPRRGSSKASWGGALDRAFRRFATGPARRARAGAATSPAFRGPVAAGTAAPETRLFVEPRGYVFDVRIGTLPLPTWMAVRRLDPSAIALLLPTHAACAGLAGEQVGIVAGRQVAYVADLDVEISMVVILADPIVEHVFTGSAVSLSAWPTDTGACTLQAAIRHEELIALESFSIPFQMDAGPSIVTIEIPIVWSVTGAVTSTVTPGEWSLLYTAPIDGANEQLVILVRVLQG